MKTEQQEIEAVRDALRSAESKLRAAIAGTGRVVNINLKSGRVDLANEASRVLGEMHKALGALLVEHSRWTDVLLENWPGFGAEVVAYGPGR